jgi:two-component system LytT family sensor kinase
MNHVAHLQNDRLFDAARIDSFKAENSKMAEPRGEIRFSDLEEFKGGFRRHQGTLHYNVRQYCMLEQHFILLVKLAVAASVASILGRATAFKRMLMREERTLNQRVQMAFGFATIFGSGVAVRVITGSYNAVDLGLEGSLLAGMLGGYVTGLLSGVIISIPAMIHGEVLSMPLFAGVGVLGGLLRDLAPDPEEIWHFSLLRKAPDARRNGFNLLVLCSILFAEFLRWISLKVFGPRVIFAIYSSDDNSAPALLMIGLATIFAVMLPLKIWNNTRNEDKLESQQRLLNEARLAALTRQINPHFLFNTLNSISSLIRTDPDNARGVIGKLSNILRRVMREHENLYPLRDELQFIDDYMAIELVRFGDKLRFIKEIDPDTLNHLIPSMLLQPLVENCIKHGLSSKVDGGMIRVRSRLAGTHLHLLVEDDGVGIPEAKLATLFEQGIGISNVNERLKVLFGTNYRMWIDSKPGQGTLTEIEIPVSRTVLAAVS